MTEGHLVGMDVGTTHSSISLFTSAGLEIAPNREGDKLTPSVGYAQSQDMDDMVIGSRAKHVRLAQGAYCFSRPKPVLAEDPEATVLTHPETGERLTALEASTHIIRYLLDYGRDYFEVDIRGAVIGVPSRFGQQAREATKRAAHDAGLDEVELRKEPTLALQAQLHTDPRMPEGWIGVFDVGGGTFDLSICRVIKGEGTRVSASDGSPRLGGDDFTVPIRQYILEQFREEHGIEFDPESEEEDRQTLQVTDEKAEKIKQDLSGLQETMTSLVAKGKQVTVELTRKKLESLNSDNIEAIRGKAEDAIEESELGSADELACLLLVGGGSKIPIISSLAEEIAGPDVPIRQAGEPDLAVVRGAALEAARLDEKPLYNIPVESTQVEDVTSMSIGVACCRRDDPDPENRIVNQLIPAGEPLPAKGSETFLLAVPDGASSGDHIEASDLIITQGKHQAAFRPELEIKRFPLEGMEPQQGDSKKVCVVAEVDRSGIATIECRDRETGQKIEGTLDCNIREKGE